MKARHLDEYTVAMIADHFGMHPDELRMEVEGPPRERGDCCDWPVVSWQGRRSCTRSGEPVGQLHLCHQHINSFERTVHDWIDPWDKRLGIRPLDIASLVETLARRAQRDPEIKKWISEGLGDLVDVRSRLNDLWSA